MDKCCMDNVAWSNGTGPLVNRVLMWLFASARHLAWQVGQGDVGVLVLGGTAQLVVIDDDEYDQSMIQVVIV